MVKQTIQIFARVKPSVRKQQQGIYSIDEDEKLAHSLEIVLPRDLADGFVNNKRESYKFNPSQLWTSFGTPRWFQRIFDQEAKQEIIFENIAKPVAESTLAGYNGTIFAYGQTGSGKTFTITGGAERYSDRGIIPRTLSYIFEQLQKDSSKIYTTHISYLEIYNECGYDLLDPRHEASRLEDLPKTPMNQASTRSHCIFTVHLSSKEPGSATVRHAKLHLVDLAGSERVSKTGVGGLLLTEAKYINLSLHYLEQVIIALSEKHRTHIPYRNSMMTSVLRDSLGGNCMTTMIATLSLEKRNIDESISTCRFAQRVALIKNEAILNEEIDPRLMIVRLQKEIADLKAELAMATGEQRTEALTEAEILQLEKLIASFLEDQDRESRLEVGPDMRKIHHCFHHFKRMREEMSLGRQEAFEIFKRDHADNVTIEDNKQILKQRFSEAKALGESINEARSKIGQLKDAINQRHLQQVALGISENMAPPSTPDPQEEKLRAQLEEEKGRYKTTFMRLKALKVEIEHLQLLMDKAKVKLQKEFEAWWAEEATSLQINSPAMNLQDAVKPFPHQDQTQLLSKKRFSGLGMIGMPEESSLLLAPVIPAKSPVAPGSQCKIVIEMPEESSLLLAPVSTAKSPVAPGSRCKIGPMSSIPLTGDSQTDSDILAFIRARQSILQKKCLGSN
ncbi:Kinesin-like protein [Apodemus speciosus]|uniref:Kinesin-like protein n=1 Tax=Apodemus speciosus TaxID=105296 RepID=A0ABQ0FPL8_APOSI